MGDAMFKKFLFGKFDSYTLVAAVYKQLFGEQDADLPLTQQDVNRILGPKAEPVIQVSWGAPMQETNSVRRSDAPRQGVVRLRNVPGTAKSVSAKFLADYAKNLADAGWPKSKWISFCENLLQQGYEVRLYAAKSSKSKYVYVIKGDRVFKVRFSDHSPHRNQIDTNDCDFFVGRSRLGITNTGDAMVAVAEFFNVS